MKKIIVYYCGKWAERLLTVERYKETAYFIDDDPPVEGTVSFFGEGSSKPVYNPDILDSEDPDNIIILISDNYHYGDAKKALEAKGLTREQAFFQRREALSELLQAVLQRQQLAVK